MNKTGRVLELYTRLVNGETVKKKYSAIKFNVDERTIERDIDEIRSHLDRISDATGLRNYVVYDKDSQGYSIENVRRIKFSNPEVLAVAKILLESRAFKKKEMEDLLKRMLRCCVPESNRKLVKELLQNEMYHYVELQHNMNKPDTFRYGKTAEGENAIDRDGIGENKKGFLQILWEAGRAIYEKKYIKIHYTRLKGSKCVERKIMPLGLFFDEFYFYLVGFIEGHEDCCWREVSPTIYRIDRIKKLEVTEEGFKIPYANRFEEGEFRKRIQFMFGGELRKTKFLYKGVSIEAVLDRLPTARILRYENGVYTMEAETFGSGICMWLRSQGDLVEIIDS